MAEKFLDKVYLSTGAEAQRALYDAWAASYDAELAENGYATPGRCAAALAGAMALRDAPILDYGCGTGFSGAALRQAGFTTIDGIDVSQGMLEVAAGRGLYRKLTRIEPDMSPPVAPGDYAAITAIGVISPGAAPVDVLDNLLDCLAPGGLIAFSLNDHAQQDPTYTGRIAALMADDGLRLLHESHGDHLPRINLNSTVYVFAKQ